MKTKRCQVDPTPFGMIGVLCGGPSAEREISLRSGKGVHEALSSLGFPTILLELSEASGEIPDQLKAARLSHAFVALHGPFGEDGKIQALLEQLEIPYTGSSVEASYYAMDKVFSRRRWLAAGLPVPRWVLTDSHQATPRLRGLKFPLIVKPVNQGSSLGMTVVDRPEDLHQAMEQAAPYGQRILLEEYLSGSEVTVGILEDRPLPIIQIVPKRRFYDFIAKYTPGMCEFLVPAPLPERSSQLIQKVALAAHRSLGCRSFSRVDMMFVPGRGPVLLELNTIPGMTPMSLLPKAASAAGIDFSELCRRMLASAMQELDVCPRDVVHS